VIRGNFYKEGYIIAPGGKLEGIHMDSVRLTAVVAAVKNGAPLIRLGSALAGLYSEN